MCAIIHIINSYVQLPCHKNRIMRKPRGCVLTLRLLCLLYGQSLEICKLVNLLTKYIVVPTDFVVGDKSSGYSQHILSSSSIYCRQNIFLPDTYCCQRQYLPTFAAYIVVPNCREREKEKHYICVQMSDNVLLTFVYILNLMHFLAT